MWETWVQSLGWEDPLEKGMATYSSILACRVPVDREDWWATVHRVTKSWTQLNNETHSIAPILKHQVVTFSSVQFLSRVWLFEIPWIATPGVHPNPCPLTQWYHPTISSSVIPFSSCPQSFPASGSFPMSQLFTSGGQSIRASAWASVLPMNTQDWSPLEWTGWTSLQSKGRSRVFFNTTVQKHQFFGTQPSL